MLIDFILLIFLFIVLAFSADVAVKNIKYIANILEIRLFAFGILLGIITSLPELSLGINSQIDNIASLSVGNLFGGVIVLFGLILGSSLILNREIKTDGLYSSIIPETSLIIFALLLGVDGKFSLIDGILMSLGYLILVFYIYKQNKNINIYIPKIIPENKITKALIFSTLNIIIILVISHFIVETTQKILIHLKINEILLGILIFSIGTNLPEIMISLTSWKKKASELSLSYLISSGFTNMLILGLIAIIKPINFNTDLSYFILIIFILLTLGLFIYFYHSNKKLEKKEGFILLSIYFIFIMTNLLIN